MKKGLNIAAKVGEDFYKGARQGLTDRDNITIAFLASGLRGLITRDSNEMIKGFGAGMIFGAVYYGVANAATGGLLTEDEEA